MKAKINLNTSKITYYGINNPFCFSYYSFFTLHQNSIFESQQHLIGGFFGILSFVLLWVFFNELWILFCFFFFFGKFFLGFFFCFCFLGVWGGGLEGKHNICHLKIAKCVCFVIQKKGEKF